MAGSARLWRHPDQPNRAIQHLHRAAMAWPRNRPPVASSAQDEARERALSLIVGFVRTDNDTSVKLVDALGWKCVGILPRDSASDPELAYYAYAVPRNRNELNEKVDCPIELAAMVAANKDGFR